MLQAAKIISAARDGMGWRQEDIAEKMGISVRQYNKYESGEFPKFKQGVAKKIDELLGTSITELIYEHSVPQETPPSKTHNRLGVEINQLSSVDPMIIIGKLSDSLKELTESNKNLVQTNEYLVRRFGPSSDGTG